MGLTWSLRASRFQPRFLPSGCIFSNRGQSCFADSEELYVFGGLLNSRAVDFIYKMSLGRFGYPEFLVGVFLSLPLPSIPKNIQSSFRSQARRAWSLARTLDTTNENSHAFLLPAPLRGRLGDFNPSAIYAELASIQSAIDITAFNLYGFSDRDRETAMEGVIAEIADAEESEDDGKDIEAPPSDALLGWAVGVAFGRFDWRLATFEQAVPAEPDPFDPLPVTSPGMLQSGAEPFHVNAGILVDDQGHSHDLTRLVEDVLGKVNIAAPVHVGRWLQKDFFVFHFKTYSKSRRKAPIYWPLATASGSYTLWVYYPTLSSQTLYTAVNDFVEIKLKQVGTDVTDLRNKGITRSAVDESDFEALQSFELELVELRDSLLKIALHYHPNHDDGVHISAAPLWPIFRHKPWQKVLKDTWAKLEKGECDWAHLAMNYWPGRVREKCKDDKSLAIIHNLEDIYVEPAAKPRTKILKKEEFGSR